MASWHELADERRDREAEWPTDEFRPDYVLDEHDRRAHDEWQRTLGYTERAGEQR